MAGGGGGEGSFFRFFEAAVVDLAAEVDTAAVAPLGEAALGERGDPLEGRPRLGLVEVSPRSSRFDGGGGVRVGRIADAVVRIVGLKK